MADVSIGEWQTLPYEERLLRLIEGGKAPMTWSKDFVERFDPETLSSLHPALPGLWPALKIGLPELLESRTEVLLAPHFFLDADGFNQLRKDLLNIAKRLTQIADDLFGPVFEQSKTLEERLQHPSNSRLGKLASSARGEIYKPSLQQHKQAADAHRAMLIAFLTSAAKDDSGESDEGLSDVGTILRFNTVLRRWAARAKTAAARFSPGSHNDLRERFFDELWALWSPHLKLLKTSKGRPIIESRNSPLFELTANTVFPLFLSIRKANRLPHKIGNLARRKANA